MADDSELCEICIKTFNFHEIKLKDFFHSIREEPKEEAKPSKVDDVADDVAGSDQISPTIDGGEPESKRSRLSPSLSVSRDQGFRPPEVSCVACLGILQHDYVQHIACAIVDYIKQVGMIGMNTYSLSIHVPVSLSIRRIGMEMGAKKCNKNSNSGTETPKTPKLSENNYAKEEFRVQLRKLLESNLAPLRCVQESPFIINLKLSHQSSFRDCIGLKKLLPRHFPRRKKRRKFFRSKKPQQPTDFGSLPVQRALEEITEEDLVKEHFFLSSIKCPCTHTIELQHSPVFVAGRYNKLSRKLPQTPWILDGVRKAETSVQELICPRIVALFRASDVRFSSSGREDVDVLMLGSGRPFLLELLNPMNVSISTKDLQIVEREINDSTDLIATRELVRVSKDSSILLKQGEEEKKKTYSALVWTDREVSEDSLRVLTEGKDLVIRQRTPIRVLHRRTLAVREKVVYLMETEKLIDANHFRLKLVTQAGTYIKEFVHGDFGRTQPNVGTLLGCDADILSLDVLDVQLQWPPKSIS